MAYGLELETQSRPLSPTRLFSCTDAERASIRAAIGRPVSTAQLRAAVTTSASRAAREARETAAALRKRPRSPHTVNTFRGVFNVPPSFNPDWRPANASWQDLGDLVALRLEKAAGILVGGYVRYFCWGSATHCPECTNPPTTYLACSSYLGRYHICLGDEFWKWWVKGRQGFMATTLLHEALHIYFKLHHGQATIGRPSVNNVYCYDTLVPRFHRRAVVPGDPEQCRNQPSSELEVSGRTSAAGAIPHVRFTCTGGCAPGRTEAQCRGTLQGDLVRAIRFARRAADLIQRTSRQPTTPAEVQERRRTIAVYTSAFGHDPSRAVPWAGGASSGAIAVRRLRSAAEALERRGIPFSCRPRPPDRNPNARVLRHEKPIGIALFPRYFTLPPELRAGVLVHEALHLYYLPFLIHGTATPTAARPAGREVRRTNAHCYEWLVVALNGHKPAKGDLTACRRTAP